MDTIEAIKLLKGMRVFVTSRERIKQPEGHDLFDKAIETLEAAESVAQGGEDGDLAKVAPLPTDKDVRDAINWAMNTASEAVKVLSTILRTKELSGFAVADEILGNIAYAQKLFNAASPVAGGEEHPDAETIRSYAKVLDDMSLCRPRTAEQFNLTTSADLLRSYAASLLPPQPRLPAAAGRYRNELRHPQ